MSVGQGRCPSYQVRRKIGLGLVESYLLGDGFTQSKHPQLGKLDYFSCNGPALAIWVRPSCVLGEEVRRRASFEVIDVTAVIILGTQQAPWEPF